MKYVTLTFSVNGKRYYIRGKTKAEAEEKRRKKKADIERGFDEFRTSMTVEEWADKWFCEYKEPTVTEYTARTLNGIMRNAIFPQIGKMKLKSVRQVHIQEILNAQTGKSKSYVQKCITLLCGMFESAVDNRYIEVSPAQRLKIPKETTSGTHRALTEEERKYFLLACEKCGNAGLWGKLMYYLGLRPSEAALVRYEDIKDGVMHIRGTKTKSADRFIPVPKELNIGSGEGYVLKTKQGNPISKSVRKRYWEVIVRRMNIEMGCEVSAKGRVLPPYKVAYDFVPYCLRHNYATMCQEAGVEIGVASKLLGHTNIGTTARIYTHDNLESMRNATKLLEEYRCR